MGTLSIKAEENSACGRVEEIEHREFVQENSNLGKFCDRMNFGGGVRVSILGRTCVFGEEADG